jgi:hypothetical protein
LGLIDRLRRVARESKEHMVAIPQKDGTVARFPQSALKEAFLCNLERARGGEHIPPEHPLTTAIRDSTDPKWQNTFFSPVEVSDELPQDLSE